MRFIFILFVLAATPIAIAHDTGPTGTFDGVGDGPIWLRIQSKDAKRHIFKAHARVGYSGCGGEFTGSGMLNGESIELRSSKKGEPISCAITVTYKENWNLVTISETTACQYFHGMKCAFNGELSRVH